VTLHLRLFSGNRCVAGYKSWRLPDTGSWFIRELVKTFANFAYKEHFMDLLVKVSVYVLVWMATLDTL